MQTQCIFWIHCTADGTKPGDDSCLLENQACSSNLDHNMNFISNISMTVTDIESKLVTAENKIETCLQQEHLSPRSGQRATQSTWAAMQALGEPSQPACRKPRWVCNSHSLSELIPLLTQRGKPASNRARIPRQRMELPWEEKTLSLQEVKARRTVKQ